jgi:hypothetical protein
MGRAGRQSVVLGTLVSEVRVRGPPGRQVPAGAVRRWPRGGFPLPRLDACAGEGARKVERAGAEAGKASSQSGPKVGRRPSKQEKSFSFLFSNPNFTKHSQIQILK